MELGLYILILIILCVVLAIGLSLHHFETTYSGVITLAIWIVLGFVAPMGYDTFKQEPSSITRVNDTFIIQTPSFGTLISSNVKYLNCSRGVTTATYKNNIWRYGLGTPPVYTTEPIKEESKLEK